MTNIEYVIKLHKRQNELVKMCNYHNLFDYNCDDIIQDLYFTLLTIDYIDRYVVNNEPNMYIIFAIIKNLIYHYRKKESKYIKEELYDFDITDEDLENSKYEFIINELESMDEKKEKEWFEKKILELYILEHHTIRSLSKETKIGINTIQPIVHRFKLRCKERYDKYIKSKK